MAERRKPVLVGHRWIDDLHDALLRDLEVPVAGDSRATTSDRACNAP